MLLHLLLRLAQPKARQKKNSLETNHAKVNEVADLPPKDTLQALVEPPVIPKIIVPTPILKKRSLNFTAFEEDLNIDIHGSQTESSIHLEPIAIDESLFESTWKEYIKVLTEEGNLGLATSFSSIDCLIEFNKIVLKISSAAIEELIKKDKAKLIEFFRKELKNESVEIETRIGENAVQKNIKSLSSKERLNEMIINNSDVLKLIQELGLELDY